MKKFRCNDCGKLFDEFSDEMFCHACGGRLEEGHFQEHKNESRQTNNDKKQNNNEAERVIINCYFCEKLISVCFPLKSLTFSCSSCNGRYQVHSTGNYNKIYFIVPLNQKKNEKSTPKKQEMPEEIKRAIILFELDESATFDEVKTRYRKCMTEYHPDKVAHLGADLRRLAEDRSKTYNNAYIILQNYFKNTKKE